MQDTIRAILRAATEEGSWEDALDRICFEVGAPASALFMSDDLELKSKSAIYSAFWRDPAREDIRSRFDAELDVSADAPAYGLFKTLPHLALVPEIDIFRSVGIVELPPSEIRDLTFSYGFRSRVVSVLNTTGPWMDVLTFQANSTRRRIVPCLRRWPAQCACGICLEPERKVFERYQWFVIQRL